MFTFWMYVLAYIVLLILGCLEIFHNTAKPVIMQVLWFAIAACLPVFMRGYGTGMNILVLVLLSFALIGIVIATLQMLGIITIGLTGKIPNL